MIEYVPAKTIVYKEKHYGWFGSDYKMNVYRGCNHGCIYCDSRSDCYRIEDFHRVKAKENALAIIRDDLRRKVKPGVVVTGATSDPYNPFEKDLLLTRHALELINAYGFGTAIATKSTLITRDADVLSDIKEHSPVLVKMTVTCADDGLSRQLEPGAPPTSERFAAIRQLADRGIYCGVLLMPILPYVTDNRENLLAILHMAKKAGARFIYAGGLTMRPGQREYFLPRLDKILPGMQERYTKHFGSEYHCPSPKARELWPMMEEVCREMGLLFRMKDIIQSYRMGYEGNQLRFF